nr:glutamate-rich protein 3-like [Lepeophtheirus salmonis]
MFSGQLKDFCKSRHYKNWNPDYISRYNSLHDRHLRSYFQHPARKTHLNKNNQITVSGEVVNEKEWRHQNLEWERRRREGEMESERLHRREVDERRARMELRQKQREEDYKKKKNEKEIYSVKSPSTAVKEAWIDQDNLLKKISVDNRQDIEHLLNFLNFEMEYILRPRCRSLGTTKLRSSNKRSNSARRYKSEYPNVPGLRSSSGGRSPLSPEVMCRKSGGIRNIEIPGKDFSSPPPILPPQSKRAPPLYFNRGRTKVRLKEFHRPRTAPTSQSCTPHSPTHPNYKEENYLLSTVVLRYVGHPDHYVRSESRARYRKHRQSKRLPPLPSHLDEITIEQQPRGSYVLEVFHGFLAVGEEFKFTSRRCEGYPFSLTIYVNRQSHVRLSTCCESRRTIGSRLGQGYFQLLHLQDAEPCIRCLIEKDPVARKHLATLKKHRGTYDLYGNRKPPTQKKLNKKKKVKLPEETLDSEGDFDALCLNETLTKQSRIKSKSRSNVKIIDPPISGDNLSSPPSSEAHYSSFEEEEYIDPQISLNGSQERGIKHSDVS